MNMSISLYKASVAAAFGGGNKHPMRTGVGRLGCLAGACLGLGAILSSGVNSLELQAVHHIPLVFFIVVLIVQIIVGLVLVGAAGMHWALQRDTFSKLLLVLPISTTKRWLLLSLPSLILALLALLFLSLPLAALCTKLGLSLLLLVPAAFIGTVSALGLTQSLPSRIGWIKVLFIPLALWTEYKLLHIIATQYQTEQTTPYPSLLFGTIVFACISLVGLQAYSVQKDIATAARLKKVRTGALPPAWWCLKKIWRSPATRFSLLAAATLSAGSLVLRQHLAMPADVLILIAALLAGTFAADIRALVRKVRPAEIIVLRGSIRYVHTFLLAAIIAGAAAVLPVLLYIQELQLYLPLIVGIAAGIFAGSAIVPQTRDITAQVGATLLTVGVLFVLPQLPLLQAFYSGHSLLYESLLVTVLVISTFYIEYQRNPFIWRIIRDCK
ncbi:MAG TPA: hypothetical protein VJ836_00180 [Candidatus Saccharimonadales bacterium]|nr:hypothetical protein [Candidatus Saccharimonadales bacterium]